MNRERTIRLDDTPAETASAPIHSTDVGTASDAASPLAHIGALAVSALSSKALARYHAYREVLLAREQDGAAIISTLTLFIWDLLESR
jgi:hypothetical protein